MSKSRSMPLLPLLLMFATQVIIIVTLEKIRERSKCKERANKMGMAVTFCSSS